MTFLLSLKPMTDYITKSSYETIELGRKLAARLQYGDNVLLFGELGAGKTHFTKGIASGFGIKEIIKSPTYAYVNHYPIGDPIGEPMGDPIGVGSIFYHYDLYRLSAGDDITSIGLEETMEDLHAINVVEWADRLGEHLPDKYIAVYFDGEGDERRISIKFVSPTIVPESAISDLYEEWVMPMHIRDHCKMVTKVAMQIADAYIKKGEIVDTELLYSAAMLHDLHRICDIRELDRSGFEEDVTDAKWDKWTTFRKKYPDTHHSKITAQILSDRGYADTAELIRLHMSKDIILESQSYNSLEKQIIFYSDKRVKHDEIVDLDERFRDGHERYAKFNPATEQDFFTEVKKATFELEKELFDPIDIDPESIA